MCSKSSVCHKRHTVFSKSTRSVIRTFRYPWYKLNRCEPGINLQINKSKLHCIWITWIELTQFMSSVFIPTLYVILYQQRKTMSHNSLQWMALDLAPRLTPGAKVKGSVALLNYTMQICTGTIIRYISI
jgi:hypothetical protein